MGWEDDRTPTTREVNPWDVDNGDSWCERIYKDDESGMQWYVEPARPEQQEDKPKPKKEEEEEENKEFVLKETDEYKLVYDKWCAHYEKTIEEFASNGLTVDGAKICRCIPKNGDKAYYVVYDMFTRKILFIFNNYEDLDFKKMAYLCQVEDKNNVLNMAKERNGMAEAEREEYRKREEKYQKELAEWKANGCQGPSPWKYWR